MPSALLFLPKICNKPFFGWGFAPDSMGGACIVPQTRSASSVCPMKGRKRKKGKRRGKEKNGKEEGRKKEGKAREKGRKMERGRKDQIKGRAGAFSHFCFYKFTTAYTSINNKIAF